VPLTTSGQQHAPGVAREPGDIPNYELLAFIDAGGFGDVWLARERVTGVRRAVKVLHKADVARAARDIEGVRRYQRCTHNSPHLLQILTVGETERCFYYVMEAADNRLPATPDGYEPSTLRTLMQARGRFAGHSALELLQKLASAVSRLHAQDLAHYDLKPENILIVDGEPKIADVGLVAPKDQPPARTGTPLYMAPEGQADDLFALGKILYELVSGRAATDFPRLPPQLLENVRPELAAAVQIANRACHGDPARRFACVADFQRTLAAGLQPERALRARWARLSRKGRILAATVLIAVAATLTLIGDAIHARVVPRIRFQDQVLLTAERWSLVSELPPLPGGPRPPYLFLNGTPLAKSGRYAYELEHPVENYLLEARFLSRRPWGSLDIELAEATDGDGAVRASLRGQPDGTGLHTLLDVAGLPQDMTSGIWGHPQPGVEYVLRLARVAHRVALALWPLARDSRAPLQVVRDLPAGQGAARYIILEASSDDALAQLDLHELRVTDYSIPLQRIDDPLPHGLMRGVQPAWVPVLPAGAAPPLGNLLAGAFHPYDSDAWNSVGNWSWWEGATPAPRPKQIRCAPCSTQMRLELQTRPGGPFAGVQLLRFDRARYGDFEATLRINLNGDAEKAPATDVPLLCASEDGTVGLALRLQDTAPAGCAWGGAYRAVILLQPGELLTARAIFRRGEGFGQTLGHECAVAVVDQQDPPTVSQAAEIERAPLFAAGGFTLGVRAVGSHFTVAVNGQQVLEADDPGGFATGRIALFASRLIATFESVEVTPLE
jgi:hypothetical protein